MFFTFNIYTCLQEQAQDNEWLWHTDHHLKEVRNENMKGLEHLCFGRCKQSRMQLITTQSSQWCQHVS